MASVEHKLLASYIKGVHQSLRLKSRSLGPDEAWFQHCQQVQVLEKYAESMKILATEYWDKNNINSSELCRIQWVVSHCVEYFHSGGFEKASEKENRLSKNFLGTSSIIEDNAVKNSLLKLLDVGSCYNPFSKFSMFDVTAVDLVPATQSVVKCDFLTAEISDSIVTTNPNIHFQKSYFDIVVFSLLLEYFPSSKQRFKCCLNAYKLLKPGGLLFILTPDSKHATANSKIMKSWRYALASIGFLRETYKKLKHLHCMAYRKCVNQQVAINWFDKQCCDDPPEEMLIIPQDFHEYPESSYKEIAEERTDTDNTFLADTFSCLPESDIFYE